ncbi:hypothetical protein BDZ94DRAFT_1323252 [Collybia nuda]|uniref:F-box domain-containing protein n=1 Tax=Collybia nuda TaxID=64659 RepID=A0A9P5Y4R9_9AGAR|nr:hypothetical protein BDZ94DRAFT_1323252 [Collybia nuda]
MMIMDETNEQDLVKKVKAFVGLSNEILSDREESVVREFLTQAEDTVSSLNADILKIRSILQVLEERCAAEVEWKTRLQVGVSPQKKVPSEVLSLIFKSCVDYRYVKLNIPPPPNSRCLALSQVCSRWREVVLAEPSLWNDLSIKNPDNVHPDTLVEIFSRAGPAMSLQLNKRPIPLAVLDVIHQYSYQLQSLELKLNFNRPVEFFDFPFRNLENLKRLTLGIMGNPTPALLSPVFSSMESASNLQEFKIQSDSGVARLDIGDSLASNFPNQKLLRLEISCGVSVAGFLHILAQCTRLVYCNATINDEDQDVVLAGLRMDPLTMTNLRSLVVFSYDENVNNVLYLLRTPSLRELRMPTSCVTLSLLLCFIQLSECHLEILDVPVSSASPSETEQLMRAIPQIISWTRFGCVINDKLLDSVGRGELLSNVEAFECCASSCKAVRKLIENRCEPHCDDSKGIIKDLLVWVKREDITDEWRELQALLPKGGGVQIQTYR